MNRRLQIDINSIENHQQMSNDQNEQYQGSQEQVQQQIQQISPHQYDMEQSSNQLQASKSRQAAYQSVQTFGNHYQSGGADFLQQLMRPNTKRQINNTANRLSETPISIQRTPNSSSRRYELQKSDIDDEIARIISKVNKTSNHNQHSHNQMHQIQKIKKIDKINKQLLKENTSLINQINILEKKLNQLNHKIPFKRQKTKGILAEDSSMLKTLKSYKQKIEKAMNLNSKLSVRLTSQRSRSNIISNTFRSMVNRQQGSSSEIVSSAIRDQTSYIQKIIKYKNSKNLFCQKCHKQAQIPSRSLSNSQDSKNFVFSPVLQVKNYQISRQNKTKQFQLIRKPAVRDFQCQINLQQSNELQQMESLAKEEQFLQKTIEANNNKIHQYEQFLYKLVQIS